MRWLRPRLRRGSASRCSILPRLICNSATLSPPARPGRESEHLMAFFTYYWNREQLLANLEEFEQTGSTSPLGYTGGSGFASRQVSQGDVLYVLNWHEGELWVLGRMTVGRVLKRAEAQAELGDIFDANEHVLAQPGHATLRVFDAIIDDDEDLDSIGFLDRSGARSHPKRNERGEIEPQTFRNVRQITEDTAELFDTYLGFARDFDLQDGKPVRRLVSFDFVVRDDTGEESAVAIDIPCSSDVLPLRWVDEDVNITDPALHTDASRLGPVLWDRVQRCCEELESKPMVDLEAFLVMVAEAVGSSVDDD